MRAYYYNIIPYIVKYRTFLPQRRHFWHFLAQPRYSMSLQLRAFYIQWWTMPRKLSLPHAQFSGGESVSEQSCLCAIVEQLRSTCISKQIVSHSRTRSANGTVSSAICVNISTGVTNLDGDTVLILTHIALETVPFAFSRTICH